MDYSAVLLSGGWESVACLIKAKQRCQEVAGLFFDYGQPYLKEETNAVAHLSAILDFHLICIKIPDMKRKGKVFIDRNKWFIKKAKQQGATEVWFGCRAPLNMFDPYGDSNWQFAQSLSKELEIKIKTPLILWPKILVKQYVRSNGISEEFIFSSEGYSYESSHLT